MLPLVKALSAKSFPDQEIYMRNHVKLLEGVLRAYSNLTAPTETEIAAKENVEKSIEIACGIINTIHECMNTFEVWTHNIEAIQEASWQFDKVVGAVEGKVAQMLLPIRVTERILQMRMKAKSRAGMDVTVEQTALNALQSG